MKESLKFESKKIHKKPEINSKKKNNNLKYKTIKTNVVFL